MSLAAVVQPLVLSNNSFESNTSTGKISRLLTSVSIIPGETSGKEQIERTLKSIRGIDAVKYYQSYHYAIIQYIPEQNSLTAIVEVARENGVNIQRLKCDRDAPYCHMRCPECPAKKREF